MYDEKCPFRLQIKGEENMAILYTTRIMRRVQARHELAKDFAFIVVGALAAVILSQSGFISYLVGLFGSRELASFVAGIFFTSAFTIAPAAVSLANIAGNTPALTVALWGALGAVCGDLVLFFLIRDRFATDLIASLRPSVARHILNSFHLGFLKWLSPVLGALIIASPLPDEFGLTLLGLSRTRVAVLVPIAFLMNVLGIYVIIWFSHFV